MSDIRQLFHTLNQLHEELLGQVEEIKNLRQQQQQIEAALQICSDTLFHNDAIEAGLENNGFIFKNPLSIFNFNQILNHKTILGLQ